MPARVSPASVLRNAEPKQWRFLADCTNNVALLLQLVAPAAPRPLFLPLLCLSSAASALTGAAAGATRAALTSHFAVARNAADVAAKEGAQETAVTLAGSLLGWAALRATRGAPRAVWPLFLVLSALHVTANARAVRCVAPRSLSARRLALLAWRDGPAGAAAGAARAAAPPLLTPSEVAPLEPLLPGGWPTPAPPVAAGGGGSAPRRLRRLRLGAPLAGPPPPPQSSSPQRCVAAVDAAGALRISLPRSATPQDAALCLFRAIRALAAGAGDGGGGDGDGDGGWAGLEARLRAAGWDAAGLALGDEGVRFAAAD